jgi:alkylation response protein AidB-like acyl-CoA dehydrogenase
VAFSFSEEQQQLRRAVRDFLQEMSPEAAVRRLMDGAEGYDPTVWKQMAGELGLMGLAIPEEYGGSGFTFVELGIVLEEMGRALLCAPYFSTVVLAANLLLHSGDERAKRDLLPGIATGETIATLALVENSARWDEAGVALRAVANSDGWVLEGEKLFVLDGCRADLVLVAARTESGVSLFAVDADAPGLTRSPMTTLDLTRKQARMRFAAVPARLLGVEGAGWPVISRVLDLAAAALACEEVGGAQRCLEMAVGYAKVREQFGRPIGSFQAIKHHCADMLVEVKQAKAAAYYAAAAAADLAEDLPVVASLAKAFCSDAYFHTTETCIQVHGGIGFTWEHPAHLYYKRAKSSELLLGSSTYHRELLAQRLGV